MRTIAAAPVVFAVLVAACGGGAPATPSSPAASAPTPRPPDAPIATPPPAAASATPAAASFTPGDVEFRVVNLRRTADGETAPVDVYVRTDGLVQAFAVWAGLEYGAATDYLAPPDSGAVVVTTAGAGDADCVATCPHIIASTSTGFGEGDARTLILYDEGTLELWHDPEPSSVGTTGNALAPADPSTALLYVVGVGLQGADFGLRLGFEGEAGCQTNRTSEGILVGGNQVAVFAYDGSAGVLLYDNMDADCSGEPVGGPFPVSGDTGSRTLLVLYGEPGSMEALSLEI